MSPLIPLPHLCLPDHGRHPLNLQPLRGQPGMISATHKPKVSAPAPRRARATRVPTGVEMYFEDINRTPLLNAREERALAERVAQGDYVARDQMVRANLRLVVNIARRYVGRG